MNLTPGDILRQYGEEMLEEMLVSFEEHYYENHHHHVSLYDGIGKLIDHLVARCAGLGLVSLKPRRAGESEVEIIEPPERDPRPGLGRRRREGQAGAGRDLPRPEGASGAAPQRTLVIGDSAADILMGQAAGVCAPWRRCGDNRTAKSCLPPRRTL